MGTIVVIARDFRQCERFVCDMVDEGMSRTDFYFASNSQMLVGVEVPRKVVKLEDCYEDKAQSIVDLYESLLCTMKYRIYTEHGFKLEQRRILKCGKSS